MFLFLKNAHTCVGTLISGHMQPRACLKCGGLQ